jgi:hypothetical protein
MSCEEQQRFILFTPRAPAAAAAAVRRDLSIYIYLYFVNNDNQDREEKKETNAMRFSKCFVKTDSHKAHLFVDIL